MTVSDLSQSAQTYLKAIWLLQEWSEKPVTATVIAERVGLRLSTVSEALRKLTEQGLVHHARYGSVTLTEAGQAHAVAMVRRHRLIESFLVRTLHYGWDEVHEEAERLEHVVSDRLVERIDALLGHPVRDPHGDPIPAADGATHRPDAKQLSQTTPGESVRVERISDADSAMLQYFAEQGVVVDAELEVLERAPYSDSTVVRVAGGADDPMSLGTRAASAIWVSVRSAPVPTG